MTIKTREQVRKAMAGNENVITRNIFMFLYQKHVKNISYGVSIELV